MMRRGLLVPIALAAMVLTGCSTNEPGVATPQPGSPTSGESSGASDAPSNQPSPGISQEAIDALDPCELLTAEELAQFGVSAEPKSRFSGGARNCRWSPEREKATDELPLVDVDIRDNVGVDGVPDIGNGLHHGQMEGTGREIAQTSKDTGCVVALSLGDNARVDVWVSMIEPEKACDMVLQLAEIVDPKLPMP